MTSNYHQHFEELVKAIESLEIFPQTIKQFTDFLKQRYLRKHKPLELVWIDKLCGEYEDSCKGYAKFVKRVVADQFLAKSLQADETQRAELIKEFKANINAAYKRLDNFLGETSRKELVDKVDGELSKMEAVQQKKDKTKKYALKFNEWLKGEILAEVGEIFSKVVSPLWNFFYTNASMAIKDDYDHEVLQEAVKNIKVNVPKMEESLDLNRRALKGISLVLDVFGDMLEKKEDDLARKEIRNLFDLQRNIIDACDRITKLIAALNDD